ncbi:hypothetical protein VNI00_007189 [Paramarasmius palmivorus]|uniref:Uncharacterized protein n=1 Tax=Paramarasmius palmivorus TaxID=297713 RepID=A0AAW0D490_9AGAR
MPPVRKGSLLKAPNTDEVIRCTNGHVKFLSEHPAVPWPASVKGVFIGCGSRAVHCVQVPLFDTEDPPYVAHVDDVVTFYWFPPFKGVLPLMFDILEAKEAVERDIQYRVYVYPQSCDLLHHNRDRNRFWYLFSHGLQVVLGPILVIKFTPSTMTPQPLHKPEVKDTLKAVFSSTRIFFDGEIPDSLAIGVADV